MIFCGCLCAGGMSGEMEVDGEEEGTFSVEAVGFSKVFNWCATGESVSSPPRPPTDVATWCSRPVRGSQATAGQSEMPDVCAVWGVLYVVGGMDGTLKIWDLATYSCRHVCAHEVGTRAMPPPVSRLPLPPRAGLVNLSARCQGLVGGVPC